MQRFIDFFDFRTLITPELIKGVYALGALGLLIWAAMLVVVPATAPQALIIGLGGSLVWRIVCEVFMLFFRIHEQLQEIADGLRRRP